MTPQERQEIARQMGLDKPPTPRVTVPEDNAPVTKEWSPSFYKAVRLIDPIETAAFERFIPDFCVLDLAIDTRIFKRGMSHLASVRIDMPPPSDDRIAATTGVLSRRHPDAMSRPNFYRWLGIIVADWYRQINAEAMGVPLIFATRAPKNGARNPWNPIVPILGAICKFVARSRSDPNFEERHLGVLRVPRHTVTHALDEPRRPGLVISVP